MLVYLLIVVNFQSWLDPFIIITALPAALAGIVWILFLTHTTLSVPALIGAIMCMGVATANSILVVSFAKDELGARRRAPSAAALDAGFTRFRPVLMTALAMIIGMVPMALGLGEGGEQNAPLGRAVIGGLVLATVATLFFVPAVFALLHGRARGPRSHALECDRGHANVEPRIVAARSSARRWSSCARGRRSRSGASPRAPRRSPVVTTRDARARRADRRRSSRPSAARRSRRSCCPGTMQAFTDAPIYARTNGYLRKWYVDIGAHVRAGQRAGRHRHAARSISSSSRRAADLATAEANARLAQSTAERYRDLIKTDSVSKQDLDNANGSLEAKQTAVDVGAAPTSSGSSSCRRSAGSTAPFDGVITARNTDVGALIDSGSNAKELFHIAAVHRLRVFVNVPEIYSRAAQPGMKADLTLDRVSRTRVHRHAGADGAVDRRRVADAADRDRRRQPQGRAAARARTPRST